MSASSLILTCCFGASRTGRPRLGLSIAAAGSAPRSCGSNSAAGRALLNQLPSSSGESSSTSSGFGLRGILSPFAVVGPPKTDHRQSWQPGRKNQHVKPLTYESQRLEPFLSVVLSRVFTNKRSAPFEPERKTERNAPLAYVARVLGRVESHEHCLYCSYINTRRASAAPKTSNPPLVQAEPQRRATRVQSAVRGTFLPAWAWRPTVGPGLTVTLGFIERQPQLNSKRRFW